MKSLKPWQIGLFALAIVAVGASAWYVFVRKDVRTASSITFVDVTTGDRYVFSLKGRHGAFVPARHPETGKTNLMPIKQIDGKWYVIDRYRGEKTEDAPTVVDPQTWEVRVSDASPRQVDN